MAALLEWIEGNKLIKKVVQSKSFTSVNFNGLSFTKHFHNNYSFENLRLGEEAFETVSIIIAPETIEITFLTKNLAYFNNPIYYFGTSGIQHEKEPYKNREILIKEFRRKIGSIIMFNKTFRVSVLMSDAYGCIIKMGCYTY
jgi:hypothetical protein